MPVDWSTKTFQRASADTTTHQTYTWVDVSGSGYMSPAVLVGVTTGTFAIQVDGGSIEHYSLSGTQRRHLFMGPRRFNSSLIITASIDDSYLYNALYILD